MINRAIISGGGTGGHIYPAVAIAQALKQAYPNIDILFVGAKGRMEMEKVPKAGFPIEGLWISGLQRKITFANLAFPLKVISSVMASRRIIRRFKPDVAIGVGGYASGPLLYAAAGMGIPTLIHEQNSYAGITNKWLSRRVDRICVAYEGMERFFPAKKMVFTGNPVRQDILHAQPDSLRSEAAAFFHLDPRKPVLLVIGGSLGARTLNQTLAKHYPQLKAHGVQVLWQTGKAYYPELKDLNDEAVRVEEFIYRMDLAYALADVVISRAGAGSISELAVVSRPAILVPSPWVTEDHQTKNALALVHKSAAWMVNDADAPDQLIHEALRLLSDEAARTQLKQNLNPFAVTDAPQRIVEQLEMLTHGT